MLPAVTWCQMPSGRVHTVITGALGWLPLGGVVVGLPPLDCAVVSAGVWSGLFLTPDLDVNGGSIAINEVRKRLGKVAAWLWYAYWWPYSKAFRHRGASHWPLIGTGTRVLYFLPANPVVLWYLGFEWWWLYLLWFAGLCLADMAHGGLDYAIKGSGV